MRKIWDESAWADYLYWQTQDNKTLKKINELIRDKTEIDDTSNRTTKTLSSAKIKENYQAKIIADVGGFFTDKTVEGALQQLGSALNGLEDLLGEI